MPSGQYPTVLAGQDLTASLLQSFATGRSWKASNTTYSSTTLAADADLQLSLAANATYDIECTVFFSTGTAGDPGMNAQLYGPAGATWTLALLAGITLGGTVGPNIITDATGSFDLHIPTASQTTAAIFKGTLFMSSTAGTYGWKFAEHTASDTVTVLAASKLTAARMA